MLPHSWGSSSQSAHFLTAQKKVHWMQASSQWGETTQWRLPHSWGERSPPSAGFPTAEGRGVHPVRASSQWVEIHGVPGFLTMKGESSECRLSCKPGKKWCSWRRYVLEIHLTVFPARTKQVQPSDGESPTSARNWGTRAWSHKCGHSTSWVKLNDPGKHPKRGTVLNIHKF